MSNKLKYFTYCWNGPKEFAMRYLRSAFEDAADTNQYALLFWADEDAFSRLAKNVTTQRLLGACHTLFGLSTRVNDTNILIISATPNTLPHLQGATQNDTVHVWTKEKTHRIRLEQLYNICTRLEKFSTQCKHCPNAENGSWQCVVSNMQRWTKRQGYQPFDICGAHTRRQTPEAFEHKLRCIGQIAEFHFVSPKHTQYNPLRVPRGETSPVRSYNTHHIERVEENIKALSERSKKSAETQRRKKICATKCLFAGVCDWLHNSWRCRATACQTSETYCDKPQEKGPFPEDEVRAVYHKWLDQMPNKRSVEDISFIVENAGTVTRARKYKMVLAGMDENLHLVEFTHTYRGRFVRRLLYEFEEARKLLRIPWRTSVRGQVYYAGPPTLRKPARLLTKDELAIYAEIRQHKAVYIDHVGFGNRYRDIDFVTLRADGSFGVYTTCGRKKRVRGFPGLVEVFFLHQTFKQFRWRDAGGEVHRESSEDTPL